MSEKNVFESLSEEILKSLEKLHIKEPTPVQGKIIPLVLEGQSVIFQSETGTGKTFAYLLPLIEKINAKNEKNPIRKQERHIKAIILAPTIELSSQIKQNIAKITNLQSALFIGGTPIKRQMETLKERPEIVVGTPTRLVELIRLKKLKTENVIATVFDEVDRLLKPELLDEITSFMDLIPENAQKIACSATIDKRTKDFFSKRSNAKIEILPNENILAEKITHWALYAENRDKIELLKKFLLAEKPEKALIFTSRLEQVQKISNFLNGGKIHCTALTAKTEKQQRQSIISQFRSGKISILVTSDLTARGLDIPGITHIIQMDLPDDKDFFIHRAGRTARAGKTGINIVIGDEYEMNSFSRLEKNLKIIVYPKQIINGKVVAPRVIEDKKL
ncbi:MAG: DEAD/DEAH box helicase [Treponema sp.]|nr:DEAD/DEAH box helicase [Treponema sp.]MBD5443230.1 DEAD/DEAH box helicase [Treponema sp.]